MCALHDGTENIVQRAEHQRGKEQDADAYGKGTQQGIDIYRFGTCHRLPYTDGNVEQRTQSGKSLAHVHHVLAKGKHLVIQGCQYGVQVGKIYRQRHHGYQYLEVSFP